jgi:hypothetical protein
MYVQFEGEREESPARQDAISKGQINTQGKYEKYDQDPLLRE